ncbi:MAG: zinc ribbon domain-containing protein [Clostridium sp.]
MDRDVAENIAEQLKDEAGESIKDNVFLSIAENILRFLWKEILSVGMYITFSLCILLLVVLVLITVTGNQCITIKKRELSASADKEVAVINTYFKEEFTMSKSCPKCGNVLNDNAAFCNKCGYQFGTNAQQRNYQQQGYQQGYQQPASGGNELIVDSDEQIVMNLQNSYVSTMAADGSIGSTRVFLQTKGFMRKKIGLLYREDLIRKTPL